MSVDNSNADSNDSAQTNDLDFLKFDGEDFGDYGNDGGWNSNMPELQPSHPVMQQSSPRGGQEPQIHASASRPMVQMPGHLGTIPLPAGAMYAHQGMHTGMEPPLSMQPLAQYEDQEPAGAQKKVAHKASTSKKRSQAAVASSTKSARPRLGSKASVTSPKDGGGRGKVAKAKKGGAKGKAGGQGAKVQPEEDPLDDEKREERNLREKERSFKISRQISMLRDLLSSGGVAVPKGTKSSVLTEAANYIRVLQQQRFNSEIERQQFVQKIRIMSSGQMGPQAQAALRQSVMLGLPVPQPGGGNPVSANAQPSANASNANANGGNSDDADVAGGLRPSDYNTVFQYSMIPMAIATMGGSFLECNKKFAELSGFPRSVLATMTIFNVVHPSNLQAAFEVVSKMIPADPSRQATTQAGVSETGALEGQLRYGECKLSVSLVRNNVGNPKYFCIQLVPTETQLKALTSLSKKALEKHPTPYTSTTG
mmetsp:Transcript_7723/g.16108  ORF Transcript_7723/g.16108 Transcript_7723/m.16108 type:complete len:481 (-) Transcript_7723:170-1612(-)